MSFLRYPMYSDRDLAMPSSSENDEHTLLFGQSMSQDSLLFFDPMPPPSLHDAETPTLQLITRHLESNYAQSEWFHILAQTISSALLFLLIFGMSATVEVTHLREQVHNKFAILTGISTQFIVMPLLGYLSVLLLKGNGLTEPMALSLLIVTASPGGSYSNWWCSMFNADLALSVTMTAISTMVSSIMLPANLLLYVNASFGFGGSADVDGNGGILSNIDWGSLFISLAIVILAIGLGLCASFKISSHRFNRFANRLGSVSGVLLIVFSGVLSSLSGNNAAQVWGQPWSFYVGVTLPCLVGLIISTCLAVFARLKKAEVVSVGVECCYQNVGIATSAAVAMFDDPIERGQALCVPLFYGIMEGLLLGLYCIIAWKLGWTKAPKDEKFCTMIVTTYEVEDDEIESEFEVEEKHDEEAQPSEINDNVRDAQNSPSSLADNSSNVESWRSNGSESDAWGSWPRSTFNIFGGDKIQHKRKRSEDRDASSPRPRQKSLSNAVREGLESITEDAFGSPGSLALFQEEDQGTYTRCRINSEDSAGGTAITSIMSESVMTDSPSSASTSSVRDKTSTNSLLKGNF